MKPVERGRALTRAADAIRNDRERRTHRPGGDIRTGARGDRVLHRGGGARDRERHRLRAHRRYLHARRGPVHRFARDVVAGQVYVNEWFAGGVETPFGGYRQSGFGREKGLAAIETFTERKNVCARVDPGERPDSD